MSARRASDGRSWLRGVLKSEGKQAGESKLNQVVAAVRCMVRMSPVRFQETGRKAHIVSVS